MNVHNSLLLVFVVGFAVICPMRVEVRELHQQFIGKGLEELSPIRGIVSLSPLIKNRMRFDSKNPYVCLAQKLFNVVATQLNATTYEPYTHFGVESIGCLVSALYLNKLHDCTQHDDDCEVLVELKSSFKGKNRLPRLKELTKLLYCSAQNGSYELLNKGLTIQLLLAFLWKKDSSVSSLERYQTYIFERVKAKELSATGNIDFLRVYDKFLQNKIRCSFFAPELEWQRNIITRRGILSCDCFYTAVRKLLNDLLYHSEKKQFQVPKGRLKVFYNCSSSMEEHIESSEVRTQWVGIIESITDLEYCGRHKAVRPSLGNLTRIFQALFNISEDEPKNLLKEFCNVISKGTEHTVTLALFDQSHETEITFNVVPTYDRKPFTVSLRLELEHADVVRSGMIDYTNLFFMRKGRKDKSEEFIIGEFLDKKVKSNRLIELDIDYLNLFAPYTNFEQHYDPIIQIIRLFSLPMDSEDEKCVAGFQWIRSLGHWRRSVDDLIKRQYSEKTAFSVLVNLISSLKNNEYILALLVRLIQISCHLNPEVRNLINTSYDKLSSNEQKDILYELIQKQAWRDTEYNNLMVKIVCIVPSWEDMNRTECINFHGSNLTKLYLDLARAQCPLDSPLAKCVLNRIKTEGTEDELRRVCYLAPHLRPDGVCISSDPLRTPPRPGTKNQNSTQNSHCCR